MNSKPHSESPTRNPDDDEILAAFQIVLTSLADCFGKKSVTEADWYSLCDSLLDELIQEHTYAAELAAVIDEQLERARFGSWNGRLQDPSPLLELLHIAFGNRVSAISSRVGVPDPLPAHLRRVRDRSHTPGSSQRVLGKIREMRSLLITRTENPLPDARSVDRLGTPTCEPATESTDDRELSDDDPALIRDHFRLLEALVRAESGELRTAGLGSIRGLSLRTLNRRLNELKEDGLVDHPKNGIWRVTDEGRRVYEEACPSENAG